MRKGRANINNKKVDNKHLYCPWNCPNCNSLGKEYTKLIYETKNILSENGESIYSPEHENTTLDYCGPRKGQVYISADSIGEKLGNAFADILKGKFDNVI